MRHVLSAIALCSACAANAQFIDERTRAANPPASHASAAAAATQAPTVVLELRKGKPIHEQLRAYGKQSGWELAWEAPEYVSPRDITVTGEFEAAIKQFLEGVNEAGTRMRATFYRGNKIVRVSEF